MDHGSSSSRSHVAWQHEAESRIVWIHALVHRRFRPLDVTSLKMSQGLIAPFGQTLRPAHHASMPAMPSTAAGDKSWRSSICILVSIMISVWLRV